MQNYRKKPVVIQAELFISLDQSAPEGAYITNIYFGDNTLCKYCKESKYKHGHLTTLEGGHIICPGDYIIKGVKGEFYPCKPDIFELTYEEAKP